MLSPSNYVGKAFKKPCAHLVEHPIPAREMLNSKKGRQAMKNWKKRTQVISSSENCDA